MSDKEYTPEVIALAHKIHKLNEEIDTYKANEVVLKSKIVRITNENRQLKATIGLLKLKEQHEKQNHKHSSPNEMEWGEFTEIPNDDGGSQKLQ